MRERERGGVLTDLEEDLSLVVDSSFAVGFFCANVDV